MNTTYTITVTQASQDGGVVDLLTLTVTEKPNLEEIFKVATTKPARRKRRTKAEMVAAREAVTT